MNSIEREKMCKEIKNSYSMSFLEHGIMVILINFLSPVVTETKNVNTLHLNLLLFVAILASSIERIYNELHLSEMNPNFLFHHPN